MTATIERTSTAGFDEEPPHGPPDEGRTPERSAATMGVYVGVIAVAIAADLFLRSGIATLATAAFALVLATAVISTGQVTSTQGRAALATGLIFAAWLPFRSSPWLVPFNATVAAGLISAATVYSSTTDLTTAAFWRLRRAWLKLFASLARLPAWLGLPVVRAVRPRHARLALSAAVGFVVAAPVVLTFTWLLASADAVFASLVQPDLSFGGLIARVLLLSLGALIGSVYLHRASVDDPSESLAVPRKLIGATEAGVVLGSVVAVFGAFVATQIVTAAGGATHIIETAGLTRAEYARDGFFQLLAVAALALTLVTTLSRRRVNDPSHPTVTVLGIVVSLLTIAIVGVSLIKLFLYIDVYGLTMLRLYTVVFAGWIGVIFLFVIAHEAGIQWLARRQSAAIVLSGLAILFGLNVLNPEAFVVHHNSSHHASGQNVVAFDARYGGQLSDDAVPALVSAAQSHSDLAAAIEVAVCANFDAEATTGWLGNYSSRTAESARATFCDR